MKRIVKSLLSVLLVLILVCSICSINVFAAGTVISFNKKSVSVGDSVVVTVTFNAGEAMYGLEGVVNYDSSVLEYKSGNAVGSAGSLKIVESPSGQTKQSYSLTFTAKKAGSCIVSVADCNYSGQTADKGLSGASATVTVKDASLSANSNLKSLTISEGSLSPAFSPSVTSYNVTVKNSVTELDVYAVASDSKAKVEVGGKSELVIGKNKRTIVVTAPNGTQKTYTINITRNETDDEVIEETPTGPLTVTVNNVNYTVLADISQVTLFNGFAAESLELSGSTVAVAVDEDENFEIFYLVAEGSQQPEPFVYRTVDNSFEKLQYLTQGEFSYIFTEIPNDTTVPEDFYTTNAKISGMDVKCYASEKKGMSDFYYIYCFADGNFGFYRFDSRENTMQRYPELELLDIDAYAESKEIEENGFFGRFASLSANGKITIIALLLVLLAIIALIILLVVRFIMNRRARVAFEDEMFEDDFDSVSVDGFVFDDRE